MKNRLFENGMVTTIVGLLFLVIAVVMWMFDEKPMEDIIAVAGYGFIFLRSKDSLIGISPKNEDRNTI